jgi:hypothetical protein
LVSVASEALGGEKGADLFFKEAGCVGVGLRGGDGES